MTKHVAVRSHYTEGRWTASPLSARTIWRVNSAMSGLDNGRAQLLAPGVDRSSRRPMGLDARMRTKWITELVVSRAEIRCHVEPDYDVPHWMTVASGMVVFSGKVLDGPRTPECGG